MVQEYSEVPTNEIPEFIFAGIGKNWYICQKVVKTFISMGIHAQALDCGHALHGDLGMLSGDSKKVLFFLSRSGTTKELVEVAKVVKMLKTKGHFKNLRTVGFSLNKNLPNTDLYDDVIVPNDASILENVCEFDDRNLVPSFSIDITQLVLDFFGVLIYEAHQDLVDNYVYHHLSGANGEKLGGPKILADLK